MMKRQPPVTTLENAIDEAFAYFHAEGAESDEAERVRRFEAAKKIIAAQPEVSIGLLASEFDTLSFQRKSAAYRLIIGLGAPAVDAVKTLLGHAGDIGRIWLVSILHCLGDDSRTSLMAELIKGKGNYAAQLAALALVFQGRQHAVEPDRLMMTLADALLSEQKIEESAFFVADSALSCLRLLTADAFVETPLATVHFYNFDHFLFSPPVHPFPYTSDRVVSLPHRQRRQWQARAVEWWEQNRKAANLKTPTSCFEQ